MKQPLSDKDGYPTEETLKAIRTWPIKTAKNLNDLLYFCQKCWSYPDRVGTIEKMTFFDLWEYDHVWYFSTGGWSGNEDVISALEHNIIFWSISWICSLRGGHFWFKGYVTKQEKNDKEKA